TWALAKSLLATAAELAAADRAPFLEARCNDPVLRAELLAMLEGSADLTAIVHERTLAPGTTLGSYVIEELLGRGGMGEVYRAHDTRLRRSVAIKILPFDGAGEPDRLRRFEREAEVVSALNHPNIVTLYEVGTSNIGPYLVLENVEGQSLRDLLGAGPLPVR